jgi:hypothetical protein
VKGDERLAKVNTSLESILNEVSLSTTTGKNLSLDDKLLGIYIRSTTKVQCVSVNPSGKASTANDVDRSWK